LRRKVKGGAQGSADRWRKIARMRWRSKFILPWLIVLVTTRAGAQSPYKFLEKQVIEQRLAHMPKADRDREAALKDRFAAVGCGGHLSEQPVRRLKEPNVICVLPGSTGQLILVSAHFDHVRAGDGAVDNWTGAALLPSLFESLSAAPHRYTFEFVGFAGEEKGLVGSRFYVGELSPGEKARIRAVVNVDSLGLSPTKVWWDYSDSELVKLLIRASDVMDLRLDIVNVEGVGNDDADPFRRSKIPTVTIHSITAETFDILHSKSDTLQAVNLSYYYDTYRLITRYLALLDASLPEPPAADSGSK
jgi:Peptidase family M28